MLGFRSARISHIGFEAMSSTSLSSPQSFSTSSSHPWSNNMADHKAFFASEGYVIARGLFDTNEVESIQSHFTSIANGEPIPGFWEPKRDGSETTVGERYPRVIMPHRWDEFTRRWLLDARWRPILTTLLGDDVMAALSMFYFKPPGSPGQALHQDNFYLHVRPGTCLGAWMAVDPARPENGCMYVIPGSHRMAIMCPKSPGDFSTHMAGMPKGMKAIPICLDPGDVLLFHGNLIHGSPANKTQTKWRRSLIGHYIPMSSTHVSKYYDVLLDLDGNRLTRELIDDGGPCGSDFQYHASYGKWH